MDLTQNFTVCYCWTPGPPVPKETFSSWRDLPLCPIEHENPYACLIDTELIITVDANQNAHTSCKHVYSWGDLFFTAKLAFVVMSYKACMQSLPK